MKILKSKRAVSVLLTALLVGGVGGAALAAPPQSGFPGRIVTIAEQATFSTNAAPWVDLPGSNATITLSQPSYLLARFTAESVCAGSIGRCPVRIVMFQQNGGLVELGPASGTDFAFDSAPIHFASHAMDRSSFLLHPGVYTVKVQAGVFAGATNLRLDDWHLTVQQVCNAPC